MGEVYSGRGRTHDRMMTYDSQLSTQTTKTNKQTMRCRECWQSRLRLGGGSAAAQLRLGPTPPSHPPRQKIESMLCCRCCDDEMPSFFFESVISTYEDLSFVRATDLRNKTTAAQRDCQRTDKRVRANTASQTTALAVLTERWQSCGSDAGDQHALTSHAAGGHGRERPVARHAQPMTSGCPPIDRAVTFGIHAVR